MSLRTRVYSFFGLFLTFSVSGESLQDALIATYQNNPALIASRSGVTATAETIDIINAERLPQVEIGANYNDTALETGGFNKNSEELQAALSASLTLWDGGMTQNAVEGARSDLRAAWSDHLNLEQQFLFATVVAYLNVLRDEKLVKMSKDNVALYAKRLEAARLTYETGNLTMADISLTEAAEAESQSSLAVYQANLAQSKSEFRELTGHNLTALEEVDHPNVPKTEAEAQKIATQKAPAINAAIESERAAQYALRQARAGHNPKIAASVREGYLDPYGNQDKTASSNVGISLSIPIYTGGRQSALVRQSESLLEAKSAATDNIRRNVEKNVSVAFSALKNVHAYKKAAFEMREARRIANETSEIQYDHGMLSVVDRLEFFQDYIAADANALIAQYQILTAEYGLLSSMGLLTIDNLGLGIAPINPLGDMKDLTPEAPQSESAKSVEKLSGRWERPE